MNSEPEKTDYLDLPLKTRPKSYSFKDIKDLVLLKGSTKHSEKTAEDSAIFEPALPGAAPLPVQDKQSLHPRTRSFIMDFRKFFSKSKTSSDTISPTKTRCSHSTTPEEVRKHLSDSSPQLRKKSLSWSHYETQKWLPKWRRNMESRSGTKRIYSPIREQHNSCKLEAVDKIDNKFIKSRTTARFLEPSTEMYPERRQLDRFLARSNDNNRQHQNSLELSKMMTKAVDKSNDVKENGQLMLPVPNTHTNAFTDCVLKSLQVRGCSCYLRLHQSYIVLCGQNKCTKLRIYLRYKHIQQIQRICSREKSEQILIKTARKKVRFNTTKHIFKDIYQLWRVFIATAGNKKKVKLLRTSKTATATAPAEGTSAFISGSSMPISFEAPSSVFAYTLDGADADYRQQILGGSWEHRSRVTDSDTTDGMSSTLEEQFFTALTEPMCASSSSVMSLQTSSSTAAVAKSALVGMPDSEFSTAYDDAMNGCASSDNGIVDVIDEKTPCQCQSHLGRVLLDEVYPLSTEQLFEILFSTTPWYHHLDEIVKKTVHGKTLGAVTDYVTTSWVTERPTVTARTVTYTMALNNAIGPRSTFVTEKQTCSEFRGAGDGFSVIKEIQNAGIPCADSFTVQCTYCVIRAGNRHSRLLVHGIMVQKKSIWGIVKGIIEKSTYGGLESHYGVLEETLKLLCGSQQPDKCNDQPGTAKKKHSKIGDLVPSKLLHGRSASSSSCLPECCSPGIAGYRMMQSVANSANETNAAAVMYSNCNVATTRRSTKEAQTQTTNFNGRETVGYGIFIIILLLMLICLQLFTLLRISHISDSQCTGTTTANSALVNTLQETEVPLNVQNFNQLPLTGEDAFKADL